jgi:hypothetical protein
MQIRLSAFAATGSTPDHLVAAVEQAISTRNEVQISSSHSEMRPWTTLPISFTNEGVAIRSECFLYFPLSELLNRSNKPLLLDLSYYFRKSAQIP